MQKSYSRIEGQEIPPHIATHSNLCAREREREREREISKYWEIGGYGFIPTTAFAP